MELWGDVQSFARRQPELFVLGTLAAGFLLGRFLSSSNVPVPNVSGPGQAAPSRYPNPNSNRGPRQGSQDIYVQGTNGNSYQQRQKSASEGGTQVDKNPRSSNFATSTRTQDKPDFNKQS